MGVVRPLTKQAHTLHVLLLVSVLSPGFLCGVWKPGSWETNLGDRETGLVALEGRRRRLHNTHAQFCQLGQVLQAKRCGLGVESQDLRTRGFWEVLAQFFQIMDVYPAGSSFRKDAE